MSQPAKTPPLSIRGTRRGVALALLAVAFAGCPPGGSGDGGVGGGSAAGGGSATGGGGTSACGDTISSSANCGACGNACATGWTCERSLCLSPRATIDNPPGWWKANTVFYQVWVSAFRHGTGAASSASVGNLAGVTDAIHSGYFTRLGVNALWLSPIFTAGSLKASSGNPHGYDTIDYLEVSTLYGNREDLSELISAAHQAGIRVLFDFVPNHTSDQHPWFQDSATSTSAAHRDWYVWKPTEPTDYPGPTFNGNNGWNSSSTGYYYGLFGGNMPDLNFRNPDVSSTMLNIAKTWLDFGFDGMRIDAVQYLFEGTTPGSYLGQPETHAWFDTLRSTVLDAYPDGGSRVMLAEEWVGDMATVLSYVKNGSAQEFNVPLDFIWPGLLVSSVSTGGAPAVTALAGHLVGQSMQVRQAGGTFGVFQSNHDLAASRPDSAYQGDGKKLYLAAALSLLGQGMPILYYGNEIAMAGDVNGPDTNMRQPFNWTAEAAQEASTDSLWRWHQALLKLRTSSAAWNDPDIAQVSADSATVLAWQLTSAATGKKAVVVANLDSTAQTFHVTVPSASAAKGVLGGTGSDTFGSGAISVSGLPGLGVRVYAIDDAAAVRVLDHDPVVQDYAAAKLDPPTALYLRGTVTSLGWAAGAGNLLTQTGLIYSRSTALNAGTKYEFKFGDATWSTYNYGPANLSWDLGHAVPSGAVVGSVGDNLAFTPAAAATYTFNFDFAHLTYWVQ